MVPSKLRIRTQELVAQFCSGDDQAYAELYDLYVQMLYNYGLKMTGDQELLKDCIHDVFVKVYLKRNEFRRQTFTTPNEVEDYEYRRAEEDVEKDFLCQERNMLQHDQVAHLMQNLTRRQRQAITLYYLEERKYDEICKIMQMNYHSVRNLMHRGMLKLREAAM